MRISTIIDDFELIDDWDERYRYIIELGRRLAPFPEQLRNEHNKVRGCASQVWLVCQHQAGKGGSTELSFLGDSDAMIVRGLIFILLSMYSGQTAEDILAVDAKKILSGLGLDTHLSQQRSNGLWAMVERIRAEAKTALAG